MFKKIIAVSTATMLTIAMSVSAFAAEKAATQAEIDALLAKVPQSLQAEAKAELAKTTLSSSQVSELAKDLDSIKADLNGKGITNVEQAQAIIKEVKEKGIDAVSAEVKAAYQAVSKAVDTVKASAKEVGITVAVDVDSLATGSVKDIVKVTVGKNTVDVELPDGTIVKGETNQPAGKTDDKNEATKPGKGGADFSTTAAVVAGLGLAVAGVAVVAKKKDLVNA